MPRLVSALITQSTKATRTMCQREVDVDMLNAVKSMLADVLSVSPSVLDEGLTLEMSTNILRVQT